jgi:hypothetical protein
MNRDQKENIQNQQRMLSYRFILINKKTEKFENNQYDLIRFWQISESKNSNIAVIIEAIYKYYLSLVRPIGYYFSLVYNNLIYYY